MSRDFSLNRAQKIRVSLTTERIMPPIVFSRHTGDCACGGPVMAIPQEDLLPLKFANREKELRIVCTPGNPLMLIDAPSGYGKTYIFEEVERSLKDEWTCIIVKLEKCQNETDIRQTIIDVLIEKDKISKSDLHQLLKSEGRDVDSLLISVLGGAGKTILMFDSIERAMDDDREWLLGNFIPDCMEIISGTEFRVIVAGRYASVYFPARLRGYEPVSLTPFSHAVVEKVLIDALKMCPPPREIDGEHLKTWSKHIVRLSGGHPRSIQRLVTDLAKNRHWAINFQNEEDKLFDKHIAREIDLIMDNLDEPMRHALEIASIFRIFNYNVASDLQKEKLPEGVTFPQDDPRSVVKKLTKSNLFTKESKHSTFYSDKTVRNLVLARIRILEPGSYQELNRLAQKIYDNWIEKLIQKSKQPQEETGPARSLDFLRTCVNESIYHFCQSFLDDNKPTQKQMADCLRKHSEDLVQGFGMDEHDPHYRIDLEDMVMGDNEIRETLEAHKLDFQTLWEIAFEMNVSVSVVAKLNCDSTPIDRKLRVFFCYDIDDKPIVQDLCQQLDATGWIEPWLDEKKLLPGQDRNLEIKKAVKTADIVIVCLSNKSVTKDGHVHKELKTALDLAKEKAEGTIYVVPVRLDNCEIPYSLAELECEDYFEDRREQALERIIQSLQARRKDQEQKKMLANTKSSAELP